MMVRYHDGRASLSLKCRHYLPRQKEFIYRSMPGIGADAPLALPPGASLFLRRII